MDGRKNGRNFTTNFGTQKMLKIPLYMSDFDDFRTIRSELTKRIRLRSRFRSKFTRGLAPPRILLISTRVNKF